MLTFKLQIELGNEELLKVLAVVSFPPSSLV